MTFASINAHYLLYSACIYYIDNIFMQMDVVGWLRSSEIFAPLNLLVPPMVRTLWFVLRLDTYIKSSKSQYLKKIMCFRADLSMFIV